MRFSNYGGYGTPNGSISTCPSSNNNKMECKEWTEHSHQEQRSMLRGLEEHPAFKMLSQHLEARATELESSVLNSVPESVFDLSLNEQNKGRIKGLRELRDVSRQLMVKINEEIRKNDEPNTTRPDGGIYVLGLDGTADDYSTVV